MRSAVWLIERPRWFKRALLILNDIAMLTIALWAAYSLRLSQYYVPETFGMVVLFAAAPIIGVITFHVRGLYKLVTRFIGPEGTARIYVAVIIAVLAWALLVLLSGVKGHPRSVVVIYGLIAAGLIRLSRQWAGAMLLRAAPQHKPVNFQERKNVIIYGAGTIGIQLLRALNETGGYNMVAFIDNNPSLAGQVVHGVKVLQARQDRQGDHHRECQRGAARHALGAAQRAARRDQGARALPGGGEDAARARRDRLGPRRGERLQADRGRGSARPRSGRAGARALTAHVKDKVVMITGAGGSIGSELTRQLLELGPKALILFELSEVALYEIEMEIEENKWRRAKEPEPVPLADTKIIPVLGSVLDRKIVAGTIAKFGVEVIYHAAAYKHVPIVEMNPFTGVQNNTFGTLDPCRSRQGGRRRALRAGVERQGGAPDQCHGREQAACRVDPSGARRAAGGRAARRRHHLHHGALRQCARFVRARWCGASAIRSRPVAR